MEIKCWNPPSQFVEKEVCITETLRGGSKFSFYLWVEGSGLEVAFSINNSLDPLDVALAKGEKAEVIRLLLLIWQHIKKHKGLLLKCSPATDYHRQAYSKLGFVYRGDGEMHYTT